MTTSLANSTTVVYEKPELSIPLIGGQTVDAVDTGSGATADSQDNGRTTLMRALSGKSAATIDADDTTSDKESSSTEDSSGSDMSEPPELPLCPGSHEALLQEPEDAGIVLSNDEFM